MTSEHLDEGAAPDVEVGDASKDPSPIKDKRRVDPETGEVREGHGSGKHAGPADPTDLPVPEANDGKEAELKADLQRLQAEYVNYRKRVERDRDVARNQAIASVMEGLLPVLDDVQLAREHGDLGDGPFVAIVDKLESTLERLGLERYGAPDEEFDPVIHEALVNTPDEKVEVETVSMVMQPGYKLGERILRAARVGVKSPQ